MEDKTIQSLEIKRARLKGVRPLTKEERKVKAEIEMLKYVRSKIQKKIDWQKELIEQAKGKESIINTCECVINELESLIKILEVKE